MAEWLQTGEHRKWNAARLLGYFYAIRPTLRATLLQEVPLLVRRSFLEPRFFFHPDERYALYKYAEEPKHRAIRGKDQKPLFHHYSWVRTSAECEMKSGSWGHRTLKDWPEEIRKAFQSKEKKCLFGMDLEFEEIADPFFDPFSVSVPESLVRVQDFPNVRRVNHRDILRTELNLVYGDCDEH
jgi:hypothetical protein